MEKVSWKKIACGANFSIALSDTNELYFTGYELSSYPDEVIHPRLFKMDLDHDVSDIAAGNTEYAIITSDSVVFLYGWRWDIDTNDYVYFRASLVLPETKIRIAEVHLTAAMVLCRTEDGRVWQWYREHSADLSKTHFFTEVELPDTVTRIALGPPCVALLSTSQIYDWDFGQSKNGQTVSQYQIDKISNGRSCVVLLTKDGKVGYVERSRFASNQLGQIHEPRFQHGLPIIQSLYSGKSEGHYFGIDENRQIWGWGRNDRGQLGKGNSLSMPATSEPSKLDFPFFGPIMVIVGAAHTIVLDGKHSLWSWGANSSGQLGQGHREDVAQPKRLNV